MDKINDLRCVMIHHTKAMPKKCAVFLTLALRRFLMSIMPSSKFSLIIFIVLKLY